MLRNDTGRVIRFKAFSKQWCAWTCRHAFHLTHFPYTYASLLWSSREPWHHSRAASSGIFKGRYVQGLSKIFVCLCILHFFLLLQSECLLDNFNHLFLSSQICQGVGEDWVEDPTNQSPLFTRNRIRMALNNLPSCKLWWLALWFLYSILKDLDPLKWSLHFIGQIIDWKVNHWDITNYDALKISTIDFSVK